MGNDTIRDGKESGSLHAIIIAVLFIALMAALGIVFYQNFIANRPKDVVTDTPAEVESNVTTRIAFDGDIYALDHPKDWKIDSLKTNEQTDGATRTQLTSPNNKVAVQLVVSPKNAEIPCDSNDGLKISYYDINPVPIANLTDSPVYLVETISDYHASGAYEYKIGLTPDGGETHAAVGDSHCNVSNVGLVSNAIIGINKLAKPAIIAMIMFPKLFPLADVAIKDMKQIKDVMATDEYKAAVKILESARKE